MSQQLLQLGVSFSSCFRLTGVAAIHLAKPRFPFEKRRFADRVLEAQINDRYVALVLMQCPDNLFFVKSAQLHRFSSKTGSDSIHFWMSLHSSGQISSIEIGIEFAPYSAQK